MFTVKALRNGKNAVYIKNDEDGRMVVAALLKENSRSGLDADIRIRPLTSGKIAIYLHNDSAGSTVLASFFEKVAPYETECGGISYPSKLTIDEENVVPFGKAPQTWQSIADGEFPY
ncbi:hypothetical protein [Brevibacillus panacihumi]|uniref:hypothetical protein n=1 Tax=Brevibacillus panacihumi TaxID=497735 RepID=UPI003D21A499